MWVEAKTKTAFTWYRKTKTWQTGIDKRHWEEYKQVADGVDIPVWLLFLHRVGNTAKDTPEGMKSPSGLFGNNIVKLQATVDHISSKWGTSGMVYWDIASLVLLVDSTMFGGPVE